DGESLVRQFLYGQRYFMSKFNRIARVGWLPDSFGFSGNLPQLMKLSGIEVFVTHKVVWNDTNEFPYHSFVWRGIDGTEIPTQVIVLSYGEPLTPVSLRKYWERYRNKDLAPFLIYAYGFSNGGGGPTREMLELVELSNAVPDIPGVKHFNEVEYVEALREARDRLPVWSGEIYVEVHRGTYTTNLKIKELMAKAEIELLQAETISAVADVLKLRKADGSTLSALWKLLLFNQFHDIVSGSSIREVYDDSTKDLEYVIESSKLITRRTLEAMDRHGLSRKNLVVFNTLPWRRRAIIEIEKSVGVPYSSGSAVECQDMGERLYVTVELPPLGYRVMEFIEAPCTSNHGVSVYDRGNGVVLENESVLLEIDRKGNIAFMKLKNAGDVFREPSNRLVAHVDKPGTWDAWDIREDFLYGGVELETISEPRITVRGPLVSCVNFVKGFENSTIHQEICLHKNSPVVSVKSRFSWNSKGVLVKAWFTLKGGNVRAFFDIPYGVVEMSTKAESTWDRARYEVPSLRWVDLVGEDASLAIIAPSRHGYSVREDRVGLSLLRSPTFPNPWSDLGVFETTYYLYPHVGNYEDAEVPRVSQELLHVVRTATIGADTGEVSLLEVEPPLVFGSLKLSEDSDGYIVRLFNPYGRSFKARVKVGPVVNISRVLEVDLLEVNVLRELELREGTLEVELGPFKLVTLKFVVR
ncbi:MAG: glycoside hydrolase family 38 C-terminal domain-containing protein, partial [Sulfolobales archaeon]|nr:glycoside hydrolase family 38 C-terminal domain-containing protein [Sulfolobales archaeon]